VDQLSIRHKLEDKIREIGGEVKGGGCALYPPFTMDFYFELDGQQYAVDLTDMDELKKKRERKSKKDNKDLQAGHSEAIDTTPDALEPPNSPF
jgi:hypothetical protein